MQCKNRCFCSALWSGVQEAEAKWRDLEKVSSVWIQELDTEI